MAPTFTERQRAGPWWAGVLVGVAAVGAWIGAVGIWAGSAGSGVGAVVLVVVVGLGLPIGFATIRLDVTVDEDAVRVRLFPLMRRTIPLGDIAAVEARRYRPVREYGGWGIKGWSTRKIAYNLRGDEGVDLTLRNGRRVLLGSQRPAELAAAIRAARGGSSSSPPTPQPGP